jgi:hypothetical protein
MQKPSLLFFDSSQNFERRWIPAFRVEHPERFSEDLSFETASNSVIDDRNFMSSGDPKICLIGLSLA